jgi:glycosyltransferase involved in cell wall biosynthesis
MSTISPFSVRTEVALPERVAAGHRTIGTEARRRIGLLLTDLNGGGIQKMTLALGQGLANRGHEVQLILYERGGPFALEVPPGIQVHYLKPIPRLLGRLIPFRADPAASLRMLLPVLLPWKPIRGLEFLPALAGHLRRSRLDALISAAPNCNLEAVWARRLAGVATRVLVSERSAPSEMLSKAKNWRSRFLPGLMNRTYQQADVIVAVSQELRDNLAAVANIPKQRIKAIYNPVVGPEVLEAAAASVTHPWFAPGQPPMILAVGRLSTQKDYPSLIRAFAMVRAKRHVRLVILGAGRDQQKTEQRQEEIASLAGELEVGADVHAAGFAANPYAYMARSAVLALSSLYEGLPAVLIQAMACGCPVVSTDCPSGPREILEDGRYGPLVPVGDVPALTAAIDTVLTQPPDKDLLRRRAQDFTVESSVDGYLQALFPDGSPQGSRS